MSKAVAEDEGNMSEERLARLEGRVEEISKRIDDLRNDMNHRFEELRGDLNKRIDDLRVDIGRHIDKVWKASLLSLGATFTILAAIIGILLKLILG